MTRFILELRQLGNYAVGEAAIQEGHTSHTINDIKKVEGLTLNRLSPA